MLFVKCYICHVLIGQFPSGPFQSWSPHSHTGLHQIGNHQKKTNPWRYQQCVFLNLDIVLISVNSVPAKFDSRAAGVEFLCPSTGDLNVRHDHQGARVWVTALWRHSHTSTQLSHGTWCFGISFINILEMKGGKTWLCFVIILQLKI